MVSFTRIWKLHSNAVFPMRASLTVFFRITPPSALFFLGSSVFFRSSFYL